MVSELCVWDTDSHRNRWKPFRDPFFESDTTTLATRNLDTPPAALDFCRYSSREYGDARGGFRIGSGTNNLMTTVESVTRVLVDIVLFRPLLESAERWNVVCFRARLSKNPCRDLSVFQPIEGELEHESFGDSQGRLRVDDGVKLALRGGRSRTGTRWRRRWN